ncbi:sigma-54 interaction domain-containing protein [Sphingopyxis sp.]|uniref:sigma-54 interaction domain-containing protein n=1 Tax=Sphingopyxis sp. TaxID=1908224 RepID=UPI002ED792BB
MAEANMEIIGQSEAISSLSAMLPKIARSDAPAFLTGSTGTGKEHFARMLHRMSDRRDRPFVAINCAAIPDTLFESELFGFEKGSFTGAHYARKGKAVLADGGTLFLDEIGELSPYSQSKLLRVLEEKEVYPIGADRPIHVDLRLIAATNRSVEDNIRTGQFRADLYYRINVARVVIPDLAERPDDIPLFIQYFIDRFNARYRTHVAMPDAALLEILKSYDWPGNIREIRNFVEAVFIDPPDGAITRQHIPLAFEKLHHMYVMSGEDERQRILDALEQTNWNKVEAAKALHWSRMTLYRKLTKYNVAQSLQEGDD